MFRALGSDVTTIALENRELDAFDPMVSSNLQRKMENQGIKLQTGFGVTRLSSTGAGITVHAKNSEVLTGFDTVILSVGRRANTHQLNLKSTGVEVNGMMTVDEFGNRNIRGVYAIGDITELQPLPPVAIAAGRTVW